MIVPEHAPPLVRSGGLRPGEQINGTVQRLPQHGAFRGNSLLVHLDDGELVALEATAKRSLTTFERALKRQAVLPGHRIRITFVGWRKTRTSQHTYRHFRVEILGERS